MDKNKKPYDNLKKIFHEPKRMAIMSALCAAGKGLTFTELKSECDLTDGNLNRHLKALSDADAVKIKKRFVGLKPQTTILLTDKGLEHFSEYLNALQEVLNQALQSVPDKKEESLPGIVNTIHAV
jgi:DNA-binding MarR family transcriptional regulator